MAASADSPAPRTGPAGATPAGATPAGATPAVAAHEVPATLRWAVRLLFVQAIAVAAVVALLLYEDLTARASSARGAVLVTVYAAMIAGILGLLGLALRRRRAWARGPAIVLQLLFLPIGYYLVAGGLPWLGLPVIAIGLGGAGALLAPATRAALGAQRGSSA